RGTYRRPRAQREGSLSRDSVVRGEGAARLVPAFRHLEFVPVPGQLLQPVLRPLLADVEPLGALGRAHPVLAAQQPCDLRRTCHHSLPRCLRPIPTASSALCTVPCVLPLAGSNPSSPSTAARSSSDSRLMM